MELLITHTGATHEAEWRALWNQLVNEPELRGALRSRASVPAPGRLGSVAETLAVVLGPGGAATALASTLVSWIRRRQGDVVVTVRRPDDVVLLEISASNVRGLDADRVRDLVKDVASALDSPNSNDQQKS